MFKEMAIESSIKISSSHTEVIEKIVDKNKGCGAKKRKDEDGGSNLPNKTSKTQSTLDAFRKEIADKSGIEQEYVGSYVGRQEIPLDFIEISPKVCPRINPWKVEGIANSMLFRFDPAKVAITVAPAKPEEFDSENLGSNSYIVIDGNHTVTALKTLDKRGQFENLVGMEERAVLCYIVNTQSPSILSYGGLRSNDIGSKFIRTPHVQDLLFVFRVLRDQFEKEGEALEVVVRYAKLLLFTADDITALRKFCSWKKDSYTKLLQIIEKYESNKEQINKDL